MECQAAGLNTEVEESAFAKFDRLKARVEQAEAEAEALAELRSSENAVAVASKEAPPEEAEDVVAELAELKRKLRK
jgi:phage shock protein A